MENNKAYVHPRIDYLLEKETSTILGVLDRDEHITYIATERRASGAWLSPSVIMLTSKRIIIMNRLAGGIKSDMSFIPFDTISTVRVSHGILFSSLHIRIKGDLGGGGIFNGKRKEGEIHGLARDEAEYMLQDVLRELKELSEREAYGHDGRHYHLHGPVINNTYVNQEPSAGKEEKKESSVPVPYENVVQQPAVRDDAAAMSESILFGLRKQRNGPEESDGDYQLADQGKASI